MLKRKVCFPGVYANTDKVHLVIGFLKQDKERGFSVCFLHDPVFGNDTSEVLGFQVYREHGKTSFCKMTQLDVPWDVEVSI